MDELQRSVDTRLIQQQKRLGKAGKRNEWNRLDKRKNQDRTPQSIVSSNFRKYLKTYELDYSLIQQYNEEVKNMERSRFVNSEVLAATYVFMSTNNIKSQQDITPEKFSDESVGLYVRNLMISNVNSNKKYSKDDLEIKQIAFKQEILRYAIMILNYRATLTANVIY